MQIHVHEYDDRLTVQTDAGEREIGRADAARIRCDAAVSRPGQRNTTTIPPQIRREVLARDRHRCQAPGCGRTRFLEVHHSHAAREGRHQRSREPHHSLQCLPPTPADDDNDADQSKWSSGTFSGLAWRGLGPALTSGRIADFAVDPRDPAH